MDEFDFNLLISFITIPEHHKVPSPVGKMYKNIALASWVLICDGAK